MLILLMGSGFSALVYQVLWLRLLGLVFGVTVHAASTVVAAFMAGLALGSFAAGRLADRVSAPLRWFGIAELLIGATAFQTPWLLKALEGFYKQIYVGVSDDIHVLTLVRFVCSLAVLLVPTSLMGATLPLALRSSIARMTNFGPRAAALYAVNTAGALAGAVVTGFYLISQVGIAASFAVAAGINAIVGITAVLCSKKPSVFAPATGAPTAQVEPDRNGYGLSAGDRGLVLAVFGLSGFVGLALEIIWFRVLVMFLPASTYMFTIILAVVLGGMAAGSALATRALRRDRDWLARLAVYQAAVAISAVGSLAAQAWTYSHGWRTGAALQGSALTVLPAMMLMGAAFPIGLHCWTVGRPRAVERAGDSVGRFYLVNLSGGIGGAVAAGFLLIPWLGTRLSLIVVSGLSLLSGLAVLAAVAVRRRRFSLATAAVSILLFTAIASTAPDPLAATLKRRFGDSRLLWREEGAQSTVSIHAGDQRVMYLDGVHQANDSAPMLATHRQIGGL
ncbi:MAG TPA: fused MFS/spermidine synthase, partial [Roseiflexaceae bacterium]